jgi:hypothetical protein
VKPAWKGTLVQSSAIVTKIFNEIKNNMNVGVIVGAFMMTFEKVSVK